VGRGLVSLMGRKASPRPFLIFSFSFSFLFLFSYSFYNFCNLVQIDSNQFVKFPRIQHSNLELSEDKFSEQGVIFKKNFINWPKGLTCII
jgi:hypothetical protein